MNKTIFLHEEVLLLAFQDQKGTIDYRVDSFLNVIAGAILAELLLAERICLEDERKKLVSVINMAPVGDSVIDEALRLMNEPKRRKNLQGWISKLAGMRNLKERVAKGLCKKGILKEEEKKILLIFTTNIYPELDPIPERKLLKRLEKAIFTNQKDVDIRTSVLVSLTFQSNLLSIPFSNKELRRNKERIEKIINGEFIGKATSEVIQAIQAATIIAAIIPTMMITTMPSSC